ncbi:MULTISPECIES: hypothetical protein [unclassified Lysinibacillus]|uniref:hypothetical protein n=1 Tax=unclassified Lysinibacillus TaxID=2636778 RepID=UPI00381916CC
MKNKAINIMTKALKLPFTPREISSAYIYIGLVYSELKMYKEASHNFHKGMTIVECEEFQYSPPFKKIIKVFIKNGDLEKATFWLDNLNNRIWYDKKFKKLGHISSYVKKEKIFCIKSRAVKKLR